MVLLYERAADGLSGIMRDLPVLLEYFDMARRGQGGHTTALMAA